MNTQICPFKVGEMVFYRPSSRGRDQGAMTDLAALKPGNKYKIARIDKDVYIVPEGFETATPSGIYWTEFSAS
jgi:hypothetical protein